MSLTITITDNDTGTTETKTIKNDFLVIAHGNRDIASVQAYGNGTQVITMKRTDPKVASDVR